MKFLELDYLCRSFFLRPLIFIQTNTSKWLFNRLLTSIRTLYIKTKKPPDIHYCTSSILLLRYCFQKVQKIRLVEEWDIHWETVDTDNGIMSSLGL